MHSSKANRPADPKEDKSSQAIRDTEKKVEDLDRLLFRAPKNNTAAFADLVQPQVLSQSLTDLLMGSSQPQATLRSASSIDRAPKGA
jgi:hypothetical protein